MIRSYRHALLASAAGVAALVGSVLLAAAASAQPASTPTTDAVTITGSFAQSSVNAGSTDTLSGVASYASGGTAHPLANSTLSISSPGSFNWNAISVTVTTAADGSFSYVTPVIPLAVSEVDFTVTSAATPSLQAGHLSITLPVNQEAQINNFTGAINPKRVLQFSACGGIAEPPADAPLDGPLDYQYSMTAHGPWKTLGVGEMTAAGSCQSATEGGTYSGKFNSPLANGYYRAYAPAVPGQMSAVSPVIHLWKYSTRITGFTITPRSVSRNGKVTVSGRLQRLAGRWIPDARQRIVIEFRHKGKTVTLSRRLITDSAGRFRGSFAVPRTATWLASFKGSGKDFATASKALIIKIR